MITFSSLFPVAVRQLSSLDPRTSFWELISRLQRVFNSPVTLSQSSGLSAPETDAFRSLPFSEEELQLQAIHKQERALQVGDENLQRRQQKDREVLGCLEKDDFSHDELSYFFKQFREICKTRSDDVCRTILKLAERRGIMTSDIGELYESKIFKDAFKRNLLQTIELILQNHPDKLMSHIYRHGGLQHLIRVYPDQVLWRTFIQTPGLKEDWNLSLSPDHIRHDDSIYERLNPELILQYAGDNNKPKLFEYILQTLSEIRGKSIADTLVQYGQRLTNCHPEIREIIKTITEETKNIRASGVNM